MAHEVVEQVEAHATRLTVAADETERLGKLSPESAAVGREADVMRMVQPKDFDRFAAHPRHSAVAVIGGCGAFGGVCGAGGVHPWKMALCDQRVQEETWGEDTDTWMASPYAPTGVAVPTEGGDVDGYWQFSSGVDRCERIFLLRKDCTIVDDSWKVAGLSSAGSKDTLAKVSLLPSYRTIDAAEAAALRTQLLDGISRAYDVTDAGMPVPFALRTEIRATRWTAPGGRCRRRTRSWRAQGENALRNDEPEKRFCRDARAGLHHAIHVAGSTYHIAAPHLDGCRAHFGAADPDLRGEMTTTERETDLTREATSRSLGGPDSLHYHRAGTGPGMLLLHGSGPGVSGWANFGRNVPAFTREYTVVIPDQPGFGSSSRPELGHEPYSITSARAILRVLDAEGLDRVDVVGNSLGGGVAVQLTLDHPDRVRRLVLMGPGGISPSLLTPQPTEGIRLLVELCEDPTRERLVAWMRAMVGDQSFLTEELIEERWRRITAPGGIDFVRDFYRAALAGMKAGGPVTTVPVWARLSEITQPTLLTYGRDDRVTPLEGALHPLRNIPNAELHVFPQCGHWAMQEKQVEFERVVLEFFSRPERGER